MSKETLGQLSDIYNIFFEDRGVLLSTYSAFGFNVCVKNLEVSILGNKITLAPGNISEMYVQWTNRSNLSESLAAILLG